MNLLKHPGVIVNPSADAAIVRRASILSHLPFWVSATALVASLLTAAYFAVFPMTRTAYVGASHAPGESPGSDLIEAIYVDEIVYAPMLIAIGAVLIFSVATIAAYVSIPSLLRRRHPDAFARADVIDGYVIDGRGLVGPSEKELWDAARIEYEAREYDGWIVMYESAPGLSEEQRSKLKSLRRLREERRTTVAEILSDDV